mmetsp:Transcript_1289/g.1511  ORF Transcript_1289/g.1511 Transcript_1289/m.1511 type:complete len:189 (+) Transcript_1289:505-1071(+)
MKSPCVICNGSGLAFNSYIPRRISKMKGNDRWSILYQRVDCGACNGSGIQIEDSYLDNMLLHYAGACQTHPRQQNMEKICADPPHVYNTKVMKKKKQSPTRFEFFKKKKKQDTIVRERKLDNRTTSGSCIEIARARRGRDQTPREISFGSDEEIQSEVTMSTTTQTNRKPTEIFRERGRSRTVYERRR